MKQPAFMRVILALLTGLAVVGTAPAQTSTDPNEGFRIT